MLAKTPNLRPSWLAELATDVTVEQARGRVTLSTTAAAALTLDTLLGTAVL
ncbi:MAG: hypothetical protein ICV57_10595, partial [Rubrobacter sp.]|nr:hypothetical protein [Rubrobacter sp.]